MLKIIFKLSSEARIDAFAKTGNMPPEIFSISTELSEVSEEDRKEIALYTGTDLRLRIYSYIDNELTGLTSSPDIPAVLHHIRRMKNEQAIMAKVNTFRPIESAINDLSSLLNHPPDRLPNISSFQLPDSCLSKVTQYGEEGTELIKKLDLLLFKFIDLKNLEEAKLKVKSSEAELKQAKEKNLLASWVYSWGSSNMIDRFSEKILNRQEIIDLANDHFFAPLINWPRYALLSSPCVCDDEKCEMTCESEPAPNVSADEFERLQMVRTIMKEGVTASIYIHTVTTSKCDTSNSKRCIRVSIEKNPITLVRSYEIF